MGNEKELVVYQEPQGGQLSLDGLVTQVQFVHDVMKRVMREGEHFGQIPGCGKKPTLLKSGAEKLALVFRLCPEFQIEEKSLDKGHREYRVICSMRGRDGTFLGQGVGVASTMETKWRFRQAKGEPIPIGKSVPREYWDLKKTSPEKAQELLGGKKFGTLKVDGAWQIVEYKGSAEKEEHDNPSDYYNTCLKVAKKRAQVDATLTCTAASDIFNQDIEDLKDNGVLDVSDSGNPPRNSGKDNSNVRPAPQRNDNTVRNTNATPPAKVADNPVPKTDVKPSIPAQQQPKQDDKIDWRNVEYKGKKLKDMERSDLKRVATTWNLPANASEAARNIRKALDAFLQEEVNLASQPVGA